MKIVNVTDIKGGVDYNIYNDYKIEIYKNFISKYGQTKIFHIHKDNNEYILLDNKLLFKLHASKLDKVVCIVHENLSELEKMSITLFNTEVNFSSHYAQMSKYINDCVKEIKNSELVQIKEISPFTIKEFNEIKKLYNFDFSKMKLCEDNNSLF